MGATLDLNKPAIGNAIDSDLDQIRNSQNFLLMIAAHGSVILPGWQTTAVSTSSPQDFSQPNSLILTRGTRVIHLKYTWANDAPTSIQMCYDDGVSSPALVCFPPIDIVFDSDGNLISAKESSLLNGLVSWYSMDEASGTRVDSHGSNDLTENGTVGQATGKVGNAADFDGTNSNFLSVAAGHGMQGGARDWSCADWVKFDDFATNYNTIRECTVDGLSTTTDYVIYASGPGQLSVLSGNGAVWVTSITSDGAFSTGTWYFVYVEFDGTTKKITMSWNDGTRDTGALVNTPSTGGGAVDFGRYYTFGTLNGQVDESPFWSRKLTTDEITELYNGGAGMAYPG